MNRPLWLAVSLALICAGCTAVTTRVARAAAASASAKPQAAKAAKSSARLYVSAHPRLMASADDLARVKKLIDTDPIAKQWSTRILQQARKDESATALKYDPPHGIENARETLLRVTHLAMAFRLTGEAKYFD